MRSSQISSGSPMETQTSVEITSAPVVPSTTSSVKVRVAPDSAAYPRQISMSSALGQYFFGAQHVKCNPIFVHAIISELPVL